VHINILIIQSIKELKVLSELESKILII